MKRDRQSSVNRSGADQDSQSPDAREPQTIDGATGKPVDTPQYNGKDRIDLSTLRDVRLELAAVYRKMARGEIGSQDGTRRAYVLKTIGDIIALAEFERRLAELETRAQLGHGGSSATALPYRAH